ncbi:flavodoxin domain-containing protein [Oceanirhabdus sp. W0125-5]|uniref:flavodoxin domain-containing protein n=1 Tax=Oceanirhabdus sp. W0125-5 TaxID=2999116 RepID=UPI0022F331E1|nr:flavodoxin domain-containing protein [Oceanirhabdus sp. W0125-5]WBW96698.1 flavodoxin domain-containing protein [Oceanirhabdus sp. W0125-5]
MKTLIIYGTKHGCTEKCAKILAEKLTGKVELYNLKEKKNLDITLYDKVIIGGSIYIGKIRKEVSQFSMENLNVLKDKKVGLYICGMHEDEVVEKQLNDAFPQELIEKAVAKESFGGEFIIKKMNFLERLIVKKVAKIDKDVSNISDEKIDNFAKVMNRV